jgi:hypothetical protein
MGLRLENIKIIVNNYVRLRLLNIEIIENNEMGLRLEILRE